MGVENDKVEYFGTLNNRRELVTGLPLGDSNEDELDGVGG